ncbi:hypothetical protein ABK040_006568 [Willaertia magna]
MFDLNKYSSSSDEEQSHPQVGLKEYLFNKSQTNHSRPSSTSDQITNSIDKESQESEEDNNPKDNLNPSNERPSVGMYNQHLSQQEKEFIKKRYFAVIEKDKNFKVTRPWATRLAKESGEKRRGSTFERFIRGELQKTLKNNTKTTVQQKETDKEKDEIDKGDSVTEKEEENNTKTKTTKKRKRRDAAPTSFIEFFEDDKTFYSKYNITQLPQQNKSKKHNSQNCDTSIKYKVRETIEEIQNKSVEELLQFIKEIDVNLFKAVEECFREQEIDGLAFVLIAEEDWKGLNLKIGHQIKLKQILKLACQN